MRPQVGFYHCFGCGEGGDVFTFLQKMDHVTFQEAVERMAARIGYELHYEDGGQASDHGNRARLLAANAAAEIFFRSQLATPAAQIGRDFLGARGFDQAAADQFGIGFAPKSFDALGNALKAQGFTELELTTAGLLSTGRSRQQLRPVPRPADLADPRHHRPDRRVRRAQAARRRARQGPQVPQHPRDADLPQEPGALRARPGQARHRQGQAGRGRRGLHRRDGLPPRGRHDRGGHLRHQLRCRAHQDHPPGARRSRQRQHLGARPGHLHLRSG